MPSTLVTRVLIAVGITMLIGFLTWCAFYIWLLALANPADHPLMYMPLWPAACTSRGCITSAAWLKQHTLMNNAYVLEEVSYADSLTTAVRKHLILTTGMNSSVTQDDVRRYREDVLHVATTEDLGSDFKISLQEYDRHVVLPYLTQEALKTERRVESTEELYALIATERSVIVLPFRFRWNKDRGEVIR